MMPTAMKTMHSDPDHAESSARTAIRASRVLRELADKNPEVNMSCQAIFAAANLVDSKVEETRSDQIQFWSEFFEKYGYEKRQLQDIACAASMFS